MYEQLEKKKENKSRAVANSVARKKSNVNQSFGFVDNRPEAIAQRKIQEIADKANGTPELKQLKAQTAAAIPAVSGYANHNFWAGTVGSFIGGAGMGGIPLGGPDPQRYRGVGSFYDLDGAGLPINVITPVDSGNVNNGRHASTDKGHRLANASGGTGTANNMFQQDAVTNEGLAGRFGLWRAHEANFLAGLGAPAGGRTHAQWEFSFNADRP
jgi:hypothetical protein